jgi:hypothetical protein
MGIPTYRYNLLPGYDNPNGKIATIPAGIAMLINKKQSIQTADPQTGSAGFAISNTNMFDQNKIRMSIAPPQSKDYTNNTKNEDDSNKVGIFFNDNSILIRTAGASFTLGDEGVHIGGKVHWENTKHEKEIMVDNSFHGLIPQTIPTAAVSIPQIPNFGKFANIANAATKMISVVDKISNVGSAIA